MTTGAIKDKFDLAVAAVVEGNVTGIYGAEDFKGNELGARSFLNNLVSERFRRGPVKNDKAVDECREYIADIALA